jgi:hypothetical protein
MIQRPSGLPGASSSERLGKVVFREPPSISSLTSRGNQPMFYLGPAILVMIILIRALPGSNCPYKEHKPFAVQ